MAEQPTVVVMQPMGGGEKQHLMQGQPVQGPPMPPGPQPGPQWMQRPAVSGCPPGLEYLAQIDQLLVKQQKEIMEIVTSWEMKNKYQITNSVGQQVYFASEESSTCERQLCGPHRGFIMHICDNMQQEVIRVVREFKCCSGYQECICGCCKGHCAAEVTVEAPVGEVVGKIRQACSSWKPHFKLETADDVEYANIRGPCCFGNICCPNTDFKITNMSEEEAEIGKVTKKWAGFAAEIITDAQTFSVEFPMDMDVRQKAVFIGAVFLIDFMCFEKTQK